jgi:hypothetical protein
LHFCLVLTLGQHLRGQLPRQVGIFCQVQHLARGFDAPI